MKNGIIENVLLNSKNRDGAASKKTNTRHISPALRHAPQLDHATEGATLLLQIPEEETGFIDALDLATWLSKCPERKTAKAGIFWGAIRWFASENPSLKGPDRDKKAIEILEDIKKDLPAKQISLSTLKVYEASLKAMANWSQKKRTVDAEETAFVDPLVAITDLLARNNISARTKLTYRSALLWHLDQKSNLTERDIQAREILCDKDVLPAKNKREQGRVVPEKDLNKILSHLEAMANKKSNGIAAMTVTWIKAGLATGLRPVEWMDASWATKDKEALQTISAKTKVGQVAYQQKPHDGFSSQALQPMLVREIPIFDDDDMEAVDKMLRLIANKVPMHLPRAKRQDALNKLYLSIKQRLYTACKYLYKGKKKFSLYAFRRQFSANAKAAVGSDLTAELMGHFSAQSPSTGYYGKANQAYSRFKLMGEQRRRQETSAGSKDSAQKMQRERG